MINLVDNNTSKSDQAESNNDSNKESFDERQLVIFKVGEEEFGVTINEVREIIRMEKITRIPNSPNYIEGVINLRGGIVVVVDLSKKLGLPRKEIDNDTRIIVIERDKNTVGMLVDSATEVLRLSGDKIRSAPSIVTKKIDVDYIEGVGILQKEVRVKEDDKVESSEKEQRLIILLDMVKVLDAKEIQTINNSSKDVDLPVDSEDDEESNLSAKSEDEKNDLKSKDDESLENTDSETDSKSTTDNTENQELSSSNLESSETKKSDSKEESTSSEKLEKKKEPKSLTKPKPKSSTSKKPKSESKKSKPKK